jgi:hypothetical protein
MHLHSLTITLTLHEHTITAHCTLQVSRLRGEVTDFKEQSLKTREAHQAVIDAKAAEEASVKSRHDTAVSQVTMLLLLAVRADATAPTAAAAT